MKSIWLAIVCCALLMPAAADVSLRVDTRMQPPRWAVLRAAAPRRQPAGRSGVLQEVLRRPRLPADASCAGARTTVPTMRSRISTAGPNCTRSAPSDEILQMYAKGHEGLIKQYTEARTTDVPIARAGHVSQGVHRPVRLDAPRRGAAALQPHGLVDADRREVPGARAAIRGLLHGRGSGSAQLRSAPTRSSAACRTAAAGRCCARRRRSIGSAIRSTSRDSTPLHGESTFEQFLAHYEEYTDVVGDHFLNLAATTLPTNAYLLAGEAKYKAWLVEYMDAWLDRMKQNGGVIPSYRRSRREDRRRGRQVVGQRLWLGIQPGQSGHRQARGSQSHSVGAPGFHNALLVTGDQKYVDAWRRMIDAVNAHVRTPAASAAGRPAQYPTMHGASGWYGWRNTPWNVGALEVWYWSQKPADLERVGSSAWIDFLGGRSPAYPEQALERDLKSIPQRLSAMRKRPHAAGQAPGRQHARLQPGGRRLAGAVDVGRRHGRPPGRT